jgi:hypothetical protein
LQFENTAAAHGGYGCDTYINIQHVRPCRRVGPGLTSVKPPALRRGHPPLTPTVSPTAIAAIGDEDLIAISKRMVLMQEYSLRRDVASCAYRRVSQTLFLYLFWSLTLESQPVRVWVRIVIFNSPNSPSSLSSPSFPFPHFSYAFPPLRRTALQMTLRHYPFLWSIARR